MLLMAQYSLRMTQILCQYPRETYTTEKNIQVKKLNDLFIRILNRIVTRNIKVPKNRLLRTTISKKNIHNATHTVT